MPRDMILSHLLLLLPLVSDQRSKFDMVSLGILLIVASFLVDYRIVGGRVVSCCYASYEVVAAGRR